MAQKPLWSTMETPFGRVSILIHRRDAVRITTEAVDDEGETLRLEGGRRLEHELIVNRVLVQGYMYVERNEEGAWSLPYHNGDMRCPNWGYLNFKKVYYEKFDDSISHSASRKLYDALLEALGDFYLENEALFDQAEVIHLDNEIGKAQDAVAKAGEELYVKQEELRKLQEAHYKARQHLSVPTITSS